MVNDEDPADIAASLGLDIGSKKGRYRPSDVSPTAMISAVVMGEGFGRPRVAGIVYLAVGALGVAINFAALRAGRVFIWLLPLTPIFLVPGLWLFVVGQPAAGLRGERVPLWARFGLGACLVVGALLGFAALMGATFVR